MANLGLRAFKGSFRGRLRRGESIQGLRKASKGLA